MPSLSAYHLTWVTLTLDVGSFFMAAPAKQSHCSLPLIQDKDRTLKDELPKSVGVQYATRDQWEYNSKKNEGMEPKQKQHAVVNGAGDGNRVQCCKEQHGIGTWNGRFMNQGRLDVVKQEMTRETINILGISELR